MVRAQAWSGDGIQFVECQVNRGPWMAMHFHNQQHCWQLECEVPQGIVNITVRATDNRGHCDEDRIEVAPKGSLREERIADGSDQHSIGAWPEKHLFGTQLGPNRNGKKW